MLNHQSLSLSYAELRQYQYEIATYTAQQNEDSIALPAHFDPGKFTSAGLDNWDHEGANVSEHDTVCVLYQDKPVSQTSKPRRSETLVKHGPQAFKETLPCQVLKDFQAPTKRPGLPNVFEGNVQLNKSDKTDNTRLADLAWSIACLNLQVKDSQVAGIVYPQTQTMPSWSATNSVWTTENVPLKQIAFLPVLPYSVTWYSAVYTEMKNLVAICLQLVQDKLPFYADEKVYCTAKETQLMRPEEFKCLVICLGTFHTAKTLLKCCRKCLDGSGAEHVWLETGMFGRTVIQNSILNGGHYSCSLEGQQLLAEAMQRLLHKEFFAEKGVSNYSEDLEMLNKLKKGIASGNISESQRLLTQFQTSS